MSETFSLTTTLKRKPAVTGLPFELVKDHILGKKYELSLVFVGDTLSRRLNKEYRGKTYIPNVLTFPIDTKEGEIFINPYRAKIEAKKNDMNFKQYVLFLFIHGLLHLKGMEHSDTMDREEQRLLKKFS